MDRQIQTRKGQRCLRNGKPTWLEETKLVLSSVPFSSGQTGWAKKHFAKRYGGYGAVAITVSILLIPQRLPWGHKGGDDIFPLSAGLVRLDPKLSFSRYVFGREQWFLEVHNKRETQFKHFISLKCLHICLHLVWIVLPKGTSILEKKARVIPKRQKKASSTMLVVSHRFELLSCNFS